MVACKENTKKRSDRKLYRSQSAITHKAAAHVQLKRARKERSKANHRVYRRKETASKWRDAHFFSLGEVRDLFSLLSKAL